MATLWRQKRQRHLIFKLNLIFIVILYTIVQGKLSLSQFFSKALLTLGYLLTLKMFWNIQVPFILLFTYVRTYTSTQRFAVNNHISTDLMVKSTDYGHTKAKSQILCGPKFKFHSQINIWEYGIKALLFAKVRKSRKQIILFSILPKNERKTSTL